MHFRHRCVRVAGVKHPQRGFVGFLPAAVGAQEHRQLAVHLHQLEGDAVGRQVPGGHALFYQRVGILGGIGGEQQQMDTRIVGGLLGCQHRQHMGRAGRLPAVDHGIWIVFRIVIDILKKLEYNRIKSTRRWTMRRLERQDYLNWLIKWKDQQIIKVVTGVRRCGKSTLFAMYQDYLRAQGVAPEQIIAINFENLDFEELTDYKALYRYVKERLLPDQMNYIFLDEVQHVADYQKAVDSLFLLENCDLYLTGSNGYFLSGELATLLTGRYVELSMMPLSFREFCTGMEENSLSLNEKFERYLRVGSFPYVLRYGYGEQEAREYMYSIYNTILLHDIVRRLKVADVNMLEAITRFVMHNIGNRTSPSTIANAMTSQGRKIDPKTVDRYLRGLTDSLLLYEARRYNIKGKKLLASMSKYYLCDVALRSLLVRSRDSDIGHTLENVVYLELKRRYPEVYVGQYGADGEVDFVAVQDGLPVYYQVAQTTLDEQVLARELAPLRQIRDNYPKYLLTLDEAFGEMNYDGIEKKNVLKWMLGEAPA